MSYLELAAEGDLEGTKVANSTPSSSDEQMRELAMACVRTKYTTSMNSKKYSLEEPPNDRSKL